MYNFAHLTPTKELQNKTDNLLLTKNIKNQNGKVILRYQVI